MSTNRASRIAKIFKVIKKHYKPVAPADRPVLEHLLYACCLQNSSHEAADEAFARLLENYFDWNEVRVTTVRELAETMNGLSDSEAAATRVKRSLQSIFEAHYTFDIDGMKKLNLGKAVKDLENLNGITKFVLDYVIQNGLGGHSIPCNEGVLKVLELLEVISEADAAKERIPGLERAIPKTKGVEFSSLLHQLGTDYHQSPYSTRVRAVLAEVDPNVKDRLPKRSSKKAAKASRTAKKADSKVTKKSGTTKKSTTSKKKSSTKRLTKKKPR